MTTRYLDDNTGTDDTGVQPAVGAIEGFVFSDVSGDGVFDADELPLEGVTLTLTGTDGDGNPLMITTTTDAGGRYYFADLIPGVYIVTQTQPTGFVDGMESTGTPGATVVGNDVIQVPVVAGEVSRANNFAEAGIDLSLISKRYFLTSTRSGVYADVVTSHAMGALSAANAASESRSETTTLHRVVDNTQKHDQTIGKSSLARSVNRIDTGQPLAGGKSPPFATEHYQAGRLARWGFWITRHLDEKRE